MRVEEHESFDGDHRYVDARPTVTDERHSLNISEDRIHLMVTWNVRNISYYYLLNDINITFVVIYHFQLTQILSYYLDRSTVGHS